jgi:hypothetical protein
MIKCYPIGNRKRNLPPCKAAPQPTALRHTAISNIVVCKILLKTGHVRVCVCVCVCVCECV